MKGKSNYDLDKYEYSGDNKLENNEDTCEAEHTIFYKGGIKVCSW